ncbi:MAG: ABC transporter permease subunit, partial [Paracoccaceae bacterium]|nr:ABC transporter permease subunit [Paracoccaceae bacterium]
MKRLITRLALIFAVLTLAGCSGNWGWYVVDPSTPKGWSNLQFMMMGAYNTILMSLTAILISVVVGLLVALPGLSDRRGWRIFNRTYVEVVRAVPILVLILWVYYGLPTLTEIK